MELSKIQTIFNEALQAADQGDLQAISNALKGAYSREKTNHSEFINQLRTEMAKPGTPLRADPDKLVKLLQKSTTFRMPELLNKLSPKQRELVGAGFDVERFPLLALLSR